MIVAVSSQQLHALMDKSLTFITVFFMAGSFIELAVKGILLH